MYEPSEKVIKTILRKNWKISDGYIDRNVTMMVTPRVVVSWIDLKYLNELIQKAFHFLKDEVRKHFNCSTLEGAELEDQGEIGTKLTHWEKRVFEVKSHYFFS